MSAPDPHRALRRRTLLLGAASSLAAVSAVTLAGCTLGGAARPSPTGRTATRPTWEQFASSVEGDVLRYADPGYDDARRVQNPRYDSARPEGILLAATVEDVVAGLAFARAVGVPVAVRSGGHSYPGWSAGGADGTGVPPSLVISTANLDSVRLDGERLTVGPGASLARVYAAAAEQGRAIASGSCGTVAIGGITLGGGIGVLSRSFGLTSDQVTALELVTADGRVLTVDAETEPDLFWAARGGGGGSLGIVTSLTFATREAPDVSAFSMAFPWEDAATVVRAWQEWAPGADDRLWSTVKLLGGDRHPSGPAITVSGTWIGPEDELEDVLDEFLDPLRYGYGVIGSVNEPVRRSYGETMLAEAGCATAEECTTAAGGSLERVSASATSSMGVRALTVAKARRLVDAVDDAVTLGGLIEGGVSLNALGGAVAQVAPDATPFPFRRALYSVQYTASFTDGADPAPFDDLVRGLRSMMADAWGTGAYVNYADAAVDDPARDYFGGNADRLLAIKKRADPDRVFDQPAFI